MLRCFVAICLLASALFAQRSVSPGNMYHKVWAVVPLVGAGTPDDPKRPMLVPTSAEQAADAVSGDRPDFLGYTMELSDDGQFALVEMTVADPMAFDRILAKAMAKLPAAETVATRALRAPARDGSDARNIPANVATRKAALESAVTGLRIFERGKASEAEILSEFRKRKAGATLGQLGRAQ